MRELHARVVRRAVELGDELNENQKPKRMIGSLLNHETGENPGASPFRRLTVNPSVVVRLARGVFFWGISRGHPPISK